MSHDTSRICASRGLWLPMSTLPSNCSHASRRFDLYRPTACLTGCKQFMFMSARPCMAEPLMGATINFDCFSHSLSPSLFRSCARPHTYTRDTYIHMYESTYTQTSTQTHMTMCSHECACQTSIGREIIQLYIFRYFLFHLLFIFTWKNSRLNSNWLDTLK